MRRLLGALSLTFLLSACMGAGSGATATPTASSGPAAGLLFAITQGATARQGETNPDTVAIVGMDGKVRAEARFQPRETPYLGPAAVPLQSVAQVVGSSVYLIDGNGTVQVLRVDGQRQVIASFIAQPKQFETWFAVSPDGSRVLAGILQFPDIGTAPADCGALLACLPPLVGRWKFDLVMAEVGVSTTRLLHIESTNHPDMPNPGWHAIFPIGWTAAGPIAIEPTHVGTQQFWGGPVYLLDRAGNEVKQVGGASCMSSSLSPGGLIACAGDPFNVELRDMGGNVVWSTGIQAYGTNFYVSPDARAIWDPSTGSIKMRAGGSVPMPDGFRVEGWLDRTTVIGRIWQHNPDVAGTLSWINLSTPNTVHDLGLNADFVSTLTGVTARPVATQTTTNASDLMSVAARVYPLMDGRYVTCDFGAAGAYRYANCPVTPRLVSRLQTVFAGLTSAPNPLGGGQDPEWATEAVTADTGPSSGMAHVVLAKPGSPASRYDLVIISVAGKLQVDDIYCTGADRATSSIYADGWMTRFQC